MGCAPLRLVAPGLLLIFRRGPTMKLWIIEFALCLILGQLAAANSPVLCSQLIKAEKNGIKLSLSNSKISTPESLPTLQSSLQKLETLIQMTQTQKGIQSEIYQRALPVLLSTQKLGREIHKSGANDQDQAYEYFYRFSKLIDLAVNYTNEIGRHADGFASVDQFSVEAYNERLSEFLQKYKSPEPILKSLIEKINANAPFNLSSSFKYISIGKKRLPDDLNFSFQYQYVFKEGILTLPELFKDRESGKNFLGISFSEYAPYDGQHGQATSFLRHDLLHAYTQKYYDLLLFQEFQADTIKKQSRLKAATHQLLTQRIGEYENIPDIQLRDAVEVSLFVLLHEQSLSYPVGITHELNLADSLDTYRSTIPQLTQTGFFGEQYRKLSKENIHLALEWVRQRAEADFMTLKELLASYNK